MLDERVIETLRRRDPDDPEPNVPLLRKVMEHIRAHPEEWNQRWWKSPRYTPGTWEVCGTVFCFAGWACELTGARWSSGDMLIDEQGNLADVSDRASEVLGLTYGQSLHLFSGANTMEKLEEILEVICGEPV